jgi:uncharacterized protein YjdB
MTADVTWTSGDEDVAVVSNASGHEGEVTGVAAGVAPITAGVEGVVSSPAVITVVPGDCVVSIAVSPPRAEICTGGEQAFTATALWADLHAEDATSYALWTSADAAVATIDSSGVATGVGPGETTITAGVGPVSGTAALAVVNSDPLSISIDPVAPTARVGDSLQFHGRMSWTCGETTDETEASVWASSDPGVATVSNDAGTRGLAAVLAPGTTTITVTATIGLGDRDDSTVLTVTE